MLHKWVSKIFTGETYSSRDSMRLILKWLKKSHFECIHLIKHSASSDLSLSPLDTFFLAAC